MDGVNWKINTNQNKYAGENINTTDDQTWKSNFYFIQGADPQFGLIHMIDSMSNPGLKEKCTWEEEIKLAEIAVEKINQLQPKPRFFIVCGDLTNEFPNKDIRSKQVSDFKQIFSKVDPDIPLLCVCGNHDVGDGPTPESMSQYRSEYGDDYYSFWCGGVFFIVYNSQYFKEPDNVKELALQQEKWLDEQLAKVAGSRIICIGHIPWFLKEIDEEESIFNIDLIMRKQMLQKFHDAGVRYMFFGHYHRNCSGFYKDMELIVSSAIGRDLGGGLPGLRAVIVREKDIIHKFYPYDKFPTHVDLKMGLL